MALATGMVHDVLELLDWKRHVFALYADVRAASGAEGWDAWREARDHLFANHPQSPLPASRRARFEGLAYFPYDPELCVLAQIEPVEPKPVEIGASKGRPITFERFGEARFELLGEAHSLDAYWLEAYGGGLFLPFADATSGEETYPAGRYLLDTVKGADLGGDGNELVLDFNFAYNPSCAYDSRWA